MDSIETFYATITQTDSSSGSFWSVIPTWTDDSGTQIVASLFLQAASYQQGPFQNETDYLGGGTLPVDAKAGTPITYSVTQTGQPDSSVYSVYYTLERLE